MSDPTTNPEPELGAPGGDDSTVGAAPEGGVASPEDEPKDTGDYGPGVDRDTGAHVGDTGSPELG